jgi:hypothetical protein
MACGRTTWSRGSYSPLSKPLALGDNAELELRELYNQRPLGDWYLTLGKQQVAWGRPTVLRCLMRSIPSPSASSFWRISTSCGFRSGPSTPSVPSISCRVTGPCSYFGFRSRSTARCRSATEPSPSPRRAWCRWRRPAPPGVVVRLDDPQRPDRILADSDAGLRLSGFVAGWDLFLK